MSRVGIKVITASLLLVIMGGFGTYLRSHQARPDRPADFSQIPFEGGGYIGSEHRFADYAYEVLKADTTTLRMYSSPAGHSFWMFIAYFSSQKYGSQIHSPKHCLPGGGYRILSIEPYDIDLGNGQTLAVNRLIIASQRRQELMLYWFQTRSGVISGEFGLKLDLMNNSVFLRPTDAAICRITMPLALTADLEEASVEATRFIREFYPAIKSALPFGR